MQPQPLEAVVSVGRDALLAGTPLIIGPWTAVVLDGRDTLRLLSVTARNPEDIGHVHAIHARDEAAVALGRALSESTTFAGLVSGRKVIFSLAYGGNNALPDAPVVQPIRFDPMFTEVGENWTYDWGAVTVR